MQAQSFFIGGVPMLFYGDEVGYTNDYSYLDDPGKSYDNRWMHRPIINWNKIKSVNQQGTVEERVFSATQQLLSLRKKLSIIADYSNIQWIETHNDHIAFFIRSAGGQKIFCPFNFSGESTSLSWDIFEQHGSITHELYNHADGKYHSPDNGHLIMEGYSFMLLEALNQ